MGTNRLTGSQAVFDIALEDDTIGLCKPEGFVHADQGVALRGEPGEDGGVNRTALVIDDGES